MDITLKRIIAYTIDIMLVSIITSFLAQVTFFNPNYDKYEETYDEYNKIVEAEDIDKDKVIELNYDLYQYRVYNSCISIATLILYFGVFEYFYNGKTLGKKLMKLKVVSNKDKKLNVGNFALRIFILNNMIFTILIMASVFIFDKTTFYYIVYVSSLLESLVLMINLLMITLRKDNRGLHDILSGTIVIPDELIVTDTKEKANRKTKKSE